MKRVKKTIVVIKRSYPPLLSVIRIQALVRGWLVRKGKRYYEIMG